MYRRYQAIQSLQLWFVKSFAYQFCNETCSYNLKSFNYIKYFKIYPILQVKSLNKYNLKYLFFGKHLTASIMVLKLRFSYYVALFSLTKIMIKVMTKMKTAFKTKKELMLISLKFSNYINRKLLVNWPNVWPNASQELPKPTFS